ncbi:MAG: hypothetical protein R6V31_10210, partial [Halohasta sp.]
MSLDEFKCGLDPFDQRPQMRNDDYITVDLEGFGDNLRLFNRGFVAILIGERVRITSGYVAAVGLVDDA